MSWIFLSLAVLAQPGSGGPPGALAPEEAQRLESKYLANVRQLTFDGKSGEGYFSPDQSKIIYQSIRGDHPFYQIYVMDLESGTDQMVSTGQGRTTCAYFHPSAESILYASSHLDPNRDRVVQQELARLEELRRNPRQRSYSWDFDPHMDIFVAKPDGSDLRRLTDAPGYDAEGSYSPDGKQIVFCSLRGNDRGNLYLMDADGSNVRQLTNSPGYNGGPFFSPDGKRIIFRAEARKKDLLQLFVIDADGTNERQLTNNDGVNWGPYWHPNGRQVIFSTSLHGHYNYELYLLDVDSGEMERVTYMFGADVLPVFSPDGKKLLWTSRRGKNRDGVDESQLFLADWVYPLKTDRAPATTGP